MLKTEFECEYNPPGQQANNSCQRATVVVKDLGHVIKLPPHLQSIKEAKRVRLQIPQMSETAQRKEKKGTAKQMKNINFLSVTSSQYYVKRVFYFSII